MAAAKKCPAKMGRGKKIALAVLAVLACGLGLAGYLRTHSKLPRDRDRAFDRGSGITLTEVSAVQTENLATLCRVWGLVKYRHPDIVDGTLNWDAELFRVLPGVLAAGDTAQAGEVIYRWLAQFPYTAPTLSTGERADYDDRAAMKNTVVADLSWVEDTAALGPSLSGYLGGLCALPVRNTGRGYVSFTDMRANFAADNAFDGGRAYQDDGVRLLALFRYWNIVEYFYPYSALTGEDWPGALRELIPLFAGAGQDREAYVLAIARASTFLHDSHVTVTSKTKSLYAHFGDNRPAVLFWNIDGQIVIGGVADNLPEGQTAVLAPGDVLLSFDGVPMEERLERCRPYICVSDDNKNAYSFSNYLLSTDKDTAEAEILRDGVRQTVRVPCFSQPYSVPRGYATGLMAEGRIGYINPADQKEGGVEYWMEEFRDTEGLIIDMRRYPAKPIRDLSEYLVPQAVPMYDLKFPDPYRPGSFSAMGPVGWGNDVPQGKERKTLYTGKVVVLMNEASISQCETTIMVLRRAPGAVVVGSPSNGANGDVLQVTLPGQVTTTFSGIGVSGPNGEQTQRVGLQPDVTVYPTPETLRQGRDVLVERALELLTGGAAAD